MEGLETLSNRILTSSKRYYAPTPLQTLPSLDFTNPSNYSLDRTTITGTDHGHNKDGSSPWSSVLLSDTYTSGVVSVTITILSNRYGALRFGLMDSNNPIPEIDEVLGAGVKNSISLDTSGHLNINTPSSRSFLPSHFRLKEGVCVRMEVDLDSTPRKVQFFVNGEAGRRYVSGIPSSVRIGFSVWREGISFRIDNISRLSQPTPISKEMVEVK
ncbi:hypothetical protein BLNAU_12796 [Blattamonas nauphoetae]|uniref:Uncharacterized protein n=1 Tax=Blattamonas nauphoetae TaxID=2049346 RepID=A0ABQ9XIJ4_9EUKA|nr:hypothetical protein BLNAU_12796 [Blattamonas nauphoetae]